MALDIFDREPIMVSYLDLYVVVAGVAMTASKNLEQEVEGSKSTLMGLPELSERQISEALDVLGVDIKKSVEVRVGLHKPRVLALQSENENSPVVYGKSFHGFLKNRNRG